MEARRRRDVDAIAVATDDRGAFEFVQLPLGRYTVAVVREGYVSVRSEPVELTPSAPHTASVVIGLPRDGMRRKPSQGVALAGFILIPITVGILSVMANGRSR